MRTSGTIRAVVLAMTVVFAALILIAGQGDEVAAGDPLRGAGRHRRR